MGTGGAPERVYQWTPTRSGTATIDTCDDDTKYDTVVYVRQASCRAGVEVACNNDTCSGGRSRVRPEVVAGVTYYIFVDGWGTRSGDFELRVTPP